jgi:adhesin transport system outer membrane protein
MRQAGRFLLLGSALVGLLAASAGAQEPASVPKDGLPVALRMTVTEHPSVKTSLSELISLGFDVESAEARRYPALTVQAQAMSSDQTQVIARLQQPLWVGGRIDGTIKASGARLAVAKAALLQLQRSMIEQTAIAYAALDGARRRLATAERNVSEHERLRDLISRRQVGGITSEADVRLAGARLAQAISQREQVRALVVRSRYDLFALTQHPIEGRVPVPDTLTRRTERGKILSFLESQSAIVLQRQAEVEVARATAELSVSEQMPSFYARLDRDVYAANQYGNVPTATRIGVAIESTTEGLGLTGWKRVKAADSRVKTAQEVVAAARNDVRRTAQSLMADEEMLERVMKSNELVVKATEDTMESFMRQYDAGRKTWVDVLNTQRELSDSWQGLDQTRTSLLETRLRLMAMLGELDETAGVLQ